jgi:uncharacterized protein
MRHLFAAIFSIILAIPVFADDSLSIAYKLETIPNPKTAGNFSVSNPDNIMSSSEKDSLEAIISQLKAATTNEIAVVVVNSIGDENPKDFATRLFNLWGIGLKGVDNGLLMLVVNDQRRVEIETGYGLEPILPDVMCKRILEKDIIPYFKQGQYGNGIITGISTIARILKEPQNKTLIEDYTDAPALEEETMIYYQEKHMMEFRFWVAGAVFLWLIMMYFLYRGKKYRCDFTHLRNKVLEKNKDRIPISLTWWITLYILAPIAMAISISLSPLLTEPFIVLTGYSTAFYLYLGFLLLDRRIRINKYVLKGESRPYDRYQALYKSHQDGWIAAYILFPPVFVLYMIWYSLKKSALRNQPLPCKKCNENMEKLDEKEDDTKLYASQILEEELGSVDYDVWLCKACAYHGILSYESLSSKYSSCNSCKAKTFYFVSSETVTPPTYSASGTGVRNYACKNCKHTSEETYSIAMLVESSSSGSDNDSGSSYSSSSGSGSSGGGSWGGGSSGGGGAGSSW